MHKRIHIVLLASLGLSVPALAAGLVVGQKDKHFSVETLTVKQGQVVDFSNDDSVTHDISVVEPDGTRRAGVVEAPGASTSIGFDKLGDFKVMCLIHPKMKLAVHVE